MDEELNLSYEKPKVQLTGEDVNAFPIMAKVKKAMLEAGAKKEEMEEYWAKSTSGDYDNLLRVAMDYVEVL